MIDLLVEAVGWTIVHFLWQGAVIGALFALLLVLVRKGPQVGYLAGCVALLAMVGTVAGTFTFQYQAASERQAAEAPAATEPAAQPSTKLVFDHCRPCHLILPAHTAEPSAHATPRRGGSCRSTAFPEGFAIDKSFTQFAASGLYQEEPEETKDDAEVAAALTPDDGQAGPPTLSWLVKLWLAGVVLLSFRFAVSWGCTQRLRERGVIADDGTLAQTLRRVAKHVGVSRPVRLVRSATVAGPTVVGWLRPLILLPAASVAGLSRSQLEAVLAHELAHIRRHDYLVNLFQHIIETILFFHPAVWWVSRKVREEREHCCDDIAAQTTGGVLDYARALATLEENRGEQLALGMAATGGSLLARIRRLCGVERQPGLPMIAFPVLILITAVVIPLSLVDAQQPAEPKRDAEAPAKPAAPRPLTSEEGMKGLRHLLAKDPEAGIPFDDFVLLAAALDEKSIVTLLDEIGMQLTGSGYQAWTRSALYAEWASRDLDAALHYFRKNHQNYRGVREQIPHALYVGSRPKDPWKALEYLRGLPDDPRFQFNFELNRRKAPMIYRNADWYKESHKRLFQELATLDPERAWKRLPGRDNEDAKPLNQNHLLTTVYPYEGMVDGFFSGLKDRETVVRFVERFGPVGGPGTEPVAIVIAKAWMRFDLVAAHAWAPPQEPIHPLGAAVLIWGVEGNAARSWARENPEAALQAIREETLPQWTYLMAESLLEGNPHLASELVAVLGKAHKPLPMPEIIIQRNPDDRPIKVTQPVTVPPEGGDPPSAWHAIRNSIGENSKVEDPDAFPEPGRQNRTPDFRARYESYRKAIASESFTKKQQTELLNILDAAFAKHLKPENAN